jgi:hypothetical protein
MEIYLASTAQATALITIGCVFGGVALVGGIMAWFVSFL